MKAYKGFNKDMTCRGFQFEEGKEYHDDKAKKCQCVFHGCKNPLDCFRYYPPSNSIYHEVKIDELDESSKEENNDSKICGKHIKIGARLDIAGIVKLAIDYCKSNINNEKQSNEDYGASSATGYKGAS